MNTIEGMKKRVDALAGQDGGNVVLIYRDQSEDQVNAAITEAWTRGNIPLVLDAEDRDL